MPVKLSRLPLHAIILLSLLQAAFAGEISAAGQKLNAYFDTLDVEHHWIAGQHVDWHTGDPDGKAASGSGPHSHCSAFAASVCGRLKIPLLHPPEHPQLDLANGQFIWLRDKGEAAGWHAIPDPIEAQASANRGEIVLAVFQAPEGMHGHIALLRASDKSAAQVNTEGPDEIQAGIDNFQTTSVQKGFKHHPGAWKERKILFYAHANPQFPQTEKSAAGAK